MDFCLYFLYLITSKTTDALALVIKSVKQIQLVKGHLIKDPGEMLLLRLLCCWIWTLSLSAFGTRTICLCLA